MTPEEHFAGHPVALAVYGRLSELLADVGPVEVRVTKSQVAFRRRTGFAFLWLPGRYLSPPHAEVVLSLALDHHDESPRFKQVAHPAPRQWMHHLEVSDPAELDGEVAAWLRAAYERAG